MLLANNKSDYQWKYCSVGGVTRVNITSGSDIAHLGELDQKLWTIISCPTKGLEFDEKTLGFLDKDGDGQIRVHEIVSAAQWLTSVFKDPDFLLRGSDTVAVDDLADNEEGKAMAAALLKLNQRMSRQANDLSLADVQAYLSALDDKCRAEQEAVETEAVHAPYGDNTEAVADAVAAIKDKVADFFMRCKLFNAYDSYGSALDVSAESIATISGTNLAANIQQIANYPLSHPCKDLLLHFDAHINPAWRASVDTFKALAFDVDNPQQTAMSETQWNAIVAKVDAYQTAVADAKAAFDKAMAERVEAEKELIAPVDKLLHFSRDFYQLLRNYVVMLDFYRSGQQAIFQAGRLYIDQRCCELCIRVDDISKHAEMANLSGMFLIYCKCTSKSANKTMDIVAVLTEGDVEGLREGKNAVFYDREGKDWDAVVTRVVDNPISLKQAFWSPYRKTWNWITEKITKSAAEKEDNAVANLQAKADSAVTNVATADAKKAEAVKKQPFDIAKFAGIFAAIGMAIGYIGGFFTALGSSIKGHPSNLVLLIVGVIVIVSGPSVFLAWLKLRKRNLGPVLNANGWAVNACIKVNARFGATLTSIAQYPKLVIEDPFAEKQTPKWVIWLRIIGILILIAFVILTLEGVYVWKFFM